MSMYAHSLKLGKPAIAYFCNCFENNFTNKITLIQVVLFWETAEYLFF
jgi:hypothetical protein